MTTSCSEEHIALVNHLLAEKDRLITEVDELVLSKDRLWQSMHKMLRKRDAKIDGLRASLSGGTATEMPDAQEDVKRLRDENRNLGERNQALEAALKQLLDREDDAGDGENENEDEEMADVGLVVKPEPMVKEESDDDAVGIGYSNISATYSAATTNPVTNKVGVRVKGAATFKLAPLITLSASGAYEFGKIEQVAPSVLLSVRNLLETLELRRQGGQNPAFPGLQFKSNGCMWAWMMGSANQTQWTVEGPRDYACAGCFKSRRARLFWLGNMKWVILPLPHAVRAEGASWEDAGYYINQGENFTAEHFPGVWQASKRPSQAKKKA